jgi:hypothetical protein
MSGNSKSATSAGGTIIAGTPSAQKPSDLPEEVATRVAEAANVPTNNRESFCDLVRFIVRQAWERDRRAVGGNAGAALVGAAKAARALHEALDNLEPDDREWLKRLWTRTPQYQRWLLELPVTAFQLAHLLSVAAGKAPPQCQGETSQPNKKGRRRGSVKDVLFHDFARWLLRVTTDSKGDLTIENEGRTGSLIDALDILREYLPKGLVPPRPAAGTLQRIKENLKAAELEDPDGDYAPLYTPLHDFDIFQVSDAE